MLQRVVEYLPVEQLYKEKSHTVKAVSRVWRTAARRALTRGRWILETETRCAFDRDAREAWALYPGEVLLLLLRCNTLAGCDYLSLVVEPTKQGFGSIVAALEKAFQLKRSCIGAVLCLLDEWTRQAMGYVPNDNNVIYFQK